MGRLWCAGLPVVTVPLRDEPRPVTVVLPYYENPVFLRQQIQGWQTYPASLLAHLSFVVVDDGSPGVTAAAVVAESALPVRVFRIEVDVRWNWLAARNIGMHHAAKGWCVLTDMDHVLPESTAAALVYGCYDPQTIYAFARVEHTGAPAAPHSASFFLTRELFWRVGGYDEALSGYYGTDGDWRRRCAAVAPIRLLEHALIRHEYVGDSSTTRYQRKQPMDARGQQIRAARSTGWRPKTLSFPYHEVTA